MQGIEYGSPRKEQNLKAYRTISLLFLALSIFIQILQGYFQRQLPRTGAQIGNLLPALLTSKDIPSLREFRLSVVNGNPAELTGVWVEDLLAYRVVRETGWSVPAEENSASIYPWAEQRGVTVLLIHDNLGGSALYELEAGLHIAAIYGDGQTVWYTSRGLSAYEAQTYSAEGFAGPFRAWDCATCSFELSVEDIQQTHFSGSPHLAFQTCLSDSERQGLVVVEADLLAD
jgi:hypothetical protein